MISRYFWTKNWKKYFHKKIHVYLYSGFAHKSTGARSFWAVIRRKSYFAGMGKFFTRLDYLSMMKTRGFKPKNQISWYRIIAWVKFLNLRERQYISLIVHFKQIGIDYAADFQNRSFSIWATKFISDLLSRKRFM